MADGSPHSLPNLDQGLDLRPAFGALYREHAGMVRRALRQLGVAPANLDDAVQDVFVVLHRRIDDFQRERSLKNWLWGIARGVASGYRRSAQRRDRLHAALPAPEGPSLPERGVARREAATILDEFLGSLDADKCAVFVLSELEGRRGPEIAAALDVNLNTVYARLRAARQRFDDAMLRHREQQQRPLFAGWLAWAWPAWLGKPAAAAGVAMVAAMAVSPTVLPGPAAAADRTSTGEALAVSTGPELADDPVVAARWPRSVVPAAVPASEGELELVLELDDDELELLPDAPEAAPRVRPRGLSTPASPIETVATVAVDELLPETVEGPPARAPWTSTVYGQPEVRHPTMLDLREDFIAELLRVAARI
ncbi:RNA polymerase sigma factor [Paraliomyxa miuraensis]|uniref:RNA polymerase sigma factor n=1 Tax=Paraliomyxa miuraensis TaxID=376150 RepID=UPI002255E45F|nr:sigma-70 family RNA polymerase sigma factor [Paraliomyxa miuraensis]MCX4242757.1 sigma-70 family RNA polymerase sigma factor [Paraliomyxa miuraensis]